MKKTLIALSVLASAAPVYAGCNSNAVVMMRSTSFGLSFGAGRSSSQMGNSRTINIPVSYDGKRGCIKQDSSLAMEVETKEKKGKSELEIFAPKVESDNLPEVQVNTYIKFNGPFNLSENITQRMEVSRLLNSYPQFFLRVY